MRARDFDLANILKVMSMSMLQMGCGVYCVLIHCVHCVLLAYSDCCVTQLREPVPRVLVLMIDINTKRHT